MALREHEQLMNDIGHVKKSEAYHHVVCYWPFRVLGVAV